MRHHNQLLTDIYRVLEDNVECDEMRVGPDGDEVLACFIRVESDEEASQMLSEIKSLIARHYARVTLGKDDASHTSD